MYITIEMVKSLIFLNNSLWECLGLDPVVIVITFFFVAWKHEYYVKNFPRIPKRVKVGIV